MKELNGFWMGNGMVIGTIMGLFYGLLFFDGITGVLMGVPVGFGAGLALGLLIDVQQTHKTVTKKRQLMGLLIGITTFLISLNFVAHFV